MAGPPARRSVLLSLALAALLGGCAAEPLNPEASPAAAEASDNGLASPESTGAGREPTGDNQSEGSPGRFRTRAPTLLRSAAPGGLDGGEPTIVASPDGWIYLTTPFPGYNAFYRSEDGGRTFSPPDGSRCMVNAPACPAVAQVPSSELIGPGDAAFALGPDGEIYYVGLLSTSAPLFGGDGQVVVPFLRSVDHGSTWSQPQDLANGSQADRPWLAIASDGTLHATWGAGAKGPQHAASRDGGQTWSAPRSMVPKGPLFTGPLAIDPRAPQTLYAAYSEEGVMLARSLDGGDTWESIDVPSRRPPDAIRMIRHFIFPVAAVDAAGTLYVVWSDDGAMPDAVPTPAAKFAAIPRVWMATSRDHGEHWRGPILLSPPDKAALMPAIVAGRPGRIAIAWYESETALPSESVPQDWHATLAESLDGDGEAPHLYSAWLDDAPAHVGTICTNGSLCAAGDRSRGDFLGLTLDPRGQPIVAWIQDMTPGPHAIAIAVVETGPTIGGFP